MRIDSNSIITEIGTLDFRVSASDGHINNASISIQEITPNFPKGMSVEGTIAVLLSVKSPEKLKNLQFSCAWSGNNTKGDACSGEGLDAWEWEKEGFLVVIGTEDGDFLSSRLNLGKMTRDNYPVSMEDNCINIDIEEFPENKQLTLHFLVSTNVLPEESDCSCWFAVDVAHDNVVKAFE